MEYIIIAACLVICAGMLMRHNLKKSNETIDNLAHANVVLQEEFDAELARIREETAKDPRTIFEKTLEDFLNPSLIKEMYVSCPSEDCDEQYLRIDKSLYVCRACGKRFHDLPLAA